MVREGRVLIPKPGSSPNTQFASDYRVKVCAPGALVAAASSSTTITVHPGHGFSAGDKFIVGTDTARYRTVSSVTSTTVVVTAAVSVASGEFLINIGADTGSSGPLFDSTPVQVYLDSGYVDAPANSTVSTDSVGRYRYWHKGIARWELVLTSTGTPVAFYTDTDSPADEDQVSYQVRYAHLFATSGTGTSTDPWVTSGSNPIQAAYNDFTGTGPRIIRCIGGVYSLGSTDGAVTIGSSTENLEGVTIEGYGMGTTESDSYEGGTIFTFSGTGSAFKIGDFTTANKTCGFFTFRKFKIMQTGTDGTGIGLLCRLVRRSLFEDVLVEDMAHGWALASISDFNTFRRCYTRDCQTAGAYIGYTTGMELPNGQCNGNLFQECDIMNLSRDAGYSNFGVFIDVDSVGNVVRDSRFHNFDTSGSAAIICRNSNRFSAKDNYLEGNYYGVWYQNSDATDDLACSIKDNYITQTESIGIYVNCGSSGLIQGGSITGNHITNPNTSSPYNAVTGIVLHNQARNFTVHSNEYVNMATADLTIGGASTTYSRLEDGALTLTGAATIGGAASIGGTLTLTTGNVTGDITLSGNLTSGGHIRGLLATQSFTGNDTIAHGGRTVVDITNTSGTNTLTVAAPSSVDGKILILRCAALTAGTFTIADSGNVSLSAAWTPDAGDTLTLVASGAVWYELARSAN